MRRPTSTRSASIPGALPTVDRLGDTCLLGPGMHDASARDRENPAVQRCQEVGRTAVASCIASAVRERVDERSWHLELSDPDIKPERLVVHEGVCQKEDQAVLTCRHHAADSVMLIRSSWRVDPRVVLSFFDNRQAV